MDIICEIRLLNHRKIIQPLLQIFQRPALLGYFDLPAHKGERHKQRQAEHCEFQKEAALVFSFFLFLQKAALLLKALFGILGKEPAAPII